MEKAHAKRKADIAVKNDKVAIQDAHDFFAWVKKTEEASAIRFNFLSSEDYVNAAFFLPKLVNTLNLVRTQ